MSQGRIRSYVREAARDQAESAFTPILRTLLHVEAGVLAVAFVDDEGETVDYASVLPPYDTKVTGAHLRVVMETLRGVAPSHGESWFLEVQATERDIVIRRINDEYILVVMVNARSITRRLLGAVEDAVNKLRAESGIPSSSWERVRNVVQVELREAVGWPYAPTAFHEAGRRVLIDDVLGRWTEVSGRYNRVCFRVRSADGEELTLIHDPKADSWALQRASR